MLWQCRGPGIPRSQLAHMTSDNLFNTTHVYEDNADLQEATSGLLLPKKVSRFVFFFLVFLLKEYKVL